MAEELALVGGVDRYLDRPELQRAEERQDLLGTVLEQRRDPIAPGHAEPGERVRQVVAGFVHLAGGERGAREVQVGPVGIGRESVRERVENRRAVSGVHGR